MSKVAILEDDIAIAGMYQFKLQQSGYEVAVAHNGKEGLELVISFRPDLILLDLMMPHMTGEQVLQEVRKAPWGANIKVIVLTNITRDEAPVGLHDLNVDQYIIKAQYTPAQVADIVDSVLGTTDRAK